MGYDLATAYDGMEGIERARTFRPDVILMDIGLPDMNGHETARRIRQQPAGKNITQIAVTGYGQEEDRRRSREAGFDYHLVKPLNFSELKNKISEIASAPRKPEVFFENAKKSLRPHPIETAGGQLRSTYLEVLLLMPVRYNYPVNSPGAELEDP